MARRVLAELVTEAIHQDKETNLSPEAQAQFYRGFEEELSEPVEKIRADKRRAFEETQELAIW